MDIYSVSFEQVWREHIVSNNYSEIYWNRSIIKVLTFYIIRDCEMVKTFPGDQVHQVSQFLILDSFDSRLLCLSSSIIS